MKFLKIVFGLLWSSIGFVFNVFLESQDDGDRTIRDHQKELDHMISSEPNHQELTIGNFWRPED